MIILLLAIALILFVFILVLGIITGVKQAKAEMSRNNSFCSTVEHSYRKPNEEDGIDSLNLPLTLSLEERQQIQNASVFLGTRYVTQSDMRKYVIDNIAKDFAAMPGWDIWDTSVHEIPEQYRRIEHAASDNAISVLCYDPKYKIAKVQGRTNIYLTSCNRCSCRDYRERRLPCKHMYALMMELEGNTEKSIIDSEHSSMHGMVFALAGHLPKKTKTTLGIRDEITKLGGEWSDYISVDCTAVIVGTSPSVERINKAKSFDMEILSPEMLQDMFT